MHQCRFGKTDRPSLQAFGAGAEIRILTLNPPSHIFACPSVFGGQATHTAAPTIAQPFFDFDARLFQAFFEPPESRTTAPAQGKSDNLARVMIRDTPSPTLAFLVLHERPEFVGFYPPGD